MEKIVMKLEERDTIAFSYAVGVTISVFAFVFVMIYLDGTKSDLIVLPVAIYYGIGYLMQKKNPKIGKLMLTLTPCMGSIVIVVSNTGHYAGMDQTYFLGLIIAVVFYDSIRVVFTAVLVLVSNITGFIICPEAYLKIHNMTVWVYVLILYIIAAFCAYFIAGRTHNLFEKERQLKIYECELMHIQTLEKKNEEHSKFIHDMHHYFTAIGNLATDGDCENILSILNDLNVEISSQEAIVYTAHPVMNAILSEKFSYAQSHDIPMDIYVEPNIRFDHLADGDIIIMLGNLLDNALEAVGKLKEQSPDIKVRIYRENEGRICIIKIENSYVTAVKYNKSGRIRTSKREELHGYGLKNINAAAKKYGGYLQCFHENNTFTSILILPCK